MSSNPGASAAVPPPPPPRPDERLIGEMEKPRARTSVTAPRRHWHLIGRHTHPEWHGHCDPAKRGYKPCDRPHWHFLWRHRHAD